MFFRQKSYTLEYVVDDFEIEETYDKELKYYRFSLSVGKNIFVMNVVDAKFLTKKLIEEVKVFDSDEAYCVLMKGEKIKSYPICLKDDELVDYDLLTEKNEDFFERLNEQKSGLIFEGIEFSDTMDKSYLIWDHKGYYYVNSKTQKKIEFLSKESYLNNMAYGVSQYVLTSNYDESYNIDKFYVIDMQNGNLSEWNITEEISTNSYFLGDHSGKIYLIDRKNKAEYRLDPAKKKVERVDENGMGKVWNANWESVSMMKLVSSDYSFTNDEPFLYKLESSKLYMQMLGSKDAVLVSGKSVNQIMGVDYMDAYYLVGDRLFNYSPLRGENEILRYSELNFNSKNSIFIY